MTKIDQPAHASSFRDPSGFIYHKGDTLFRQIQPAGLIDFEKAKDTGLHQEFIEKGWLVSHEEVGLEYAATEQASKVIKPERIPFISYPYEWSFSQYKDAALLTLKIQLEALEYSMILKDASAFNIQWRDGRPVFIDTLSFADYEEGEPWVAYRQFCQHFLAPIALMCFTDVRLAKLGVAFIDGIPLELASRMLPFRTRVNLALGLHIHAHAKSQAKYADSQGGPASVERRKMSKHSMLGLLDNLKSAIEKFTWQPKGTEWGDYYDFTNYTDDAFQNKRNIIEGFLDQIQPSLVWDLGANNGLFSRIASHRGIQTVAFDIDPAAVEKNYLQIKSQKERCLLPLVMDLTNPSPSIGWHSVEREGFMARTPADLVFALALIHHIAIANNVPLKQCADFFADCGESLVIEFVPKVDTQVKILLATREDIFKDYNEEGFEAAFSDRFEIIKKTGVEGSERTLYLMRRK